MLLIAYLFVLVRYSSGCRDEMPNFVCTVYVLSQITGLFCNKILRCSDMLNQSFRLQVEYTRISAGQRFRLLLLDSWRATTTMKFYFPLIH